MRKFLSVAALVVLAGAAQAQVNYSQVSYRVVLSQATVDPLVSPTTGIVRYGVAVDATGNTAFAISQQSATPFEDHLLSVNLGTLSAVKIGSALDNDAAVAAFTNKFNISSRFVNFTNGKLIAAAQGTSAESGLYEINTTTGALSVLEANGTTATPIVGFVHLSGNDYAVQEGSFSGGSGELRILTAGTGYGASIATVASAQGLAKDAAGDLYAVAQTGTTAATITKITSPLSAPSISDVTPTDVAWTGENMTNTRGIFVANGDIIVYKRGAATATDGRLYVIDGSTIITFTAADFAAGIGALPGFAGATFDIQDTHGIAVVPAGTTQNKVYFGARSVTGGWAVTEVTFGAASVQDWANY